MKRAVDYRLYLVTDSGLMRTATLEESVRLGLEGGATLVQIREKDLGGGAFYAQVLRVREITRQYNVPLIVNDRVDVAMAAGADGVHVGQSDLPARQARALIGPDMLLGVSASTPEEAVRAEADGADYLGVGAMYATGTKTDASLTSTDTLREITRRVKIPVVAIGGLNRDTVPGLRGTGIAGIAVVSAIVSQPDVVAAARQMRALADAVTEGYRHG